MRFSRAESGSLPMPKLTIKKKKLTISKKNVIQYIQNYQNYTFGVYIKIINTSNPGMFYAWMEKSTSPCVPLSHPSKRPSDGSAATGLF